MDRSFLTEFLLSNKSQIYCIVSNYLIEANSKLWKSKIFLTSNFDMKDMSVLMIFDCLCHLMISDALLLSFTYYSLLFLFSTIFFYYSRLIQLSTKVFYYSLQLQSSKLPLSSTLSSTLCLTLS